MTERSQTMDKTRLKATIEAILFAAGYPVPYDRLCELLELEKSELSALLHELAAEYTEERGIQLLLHGDACRLCTKEAFADMVRAALGVKAGGNLSRSSMETLAIIAYHQPVTRSYVDSIRGIDSSYAVNNLTEKRLIEVCGRLDAPGRPSLYRTTDEFLRVFGIDTLDKLPPVELFAVPEAVPEKTEE